MAEDERGTDRAQDTEYKVTDRRRFTADGERRGDFADEEESPVTQTEKGSDAAEGGPGPQAQFDRRPLDEPEGVDFTMLVNAIAQPALLFLGEIPQPSGQTQLDLEQARIQIDMLDLLRVKCRGNLSSQEEGLLERVLYELRMLYVARTSKPG